MVRVHAYTCTPTAVGVRLPASRFLPISEVHMPTPEPLTPYPAKDRSNVAIIVGCVLWTGGVAWFAATVAGQLVLVALILATLALVLFGRYHPKAPSAVARLSQVWLSHWKYSVTILALTVAGLSGGRLKATFDAMTPAQHLEAARADGKAMPSSARDHLAAIPSSAPEYQEAQKLLAELAPATKRQQAPLPQEQEAAAPVRNVDAEQAAFNALTAAQHLAAAQLAMAYGFDRKERIGGDLEKAEKHLEAIPSGAAEAKRGEKIKNEISERRKRTAIVWYREERKAIANKLEQTFLDQKIELKSVQAVGKENTILRINYALCSRVLMNQLTQPEIIAGWRSKGFSRVECRNDEGSIWIDLN